MVHKGLRRKSVQMLLAEHPDMIKVTSHITVSKLLIVFLVNLTVKNACSDDVTV